VLDVILKHDVIEMITKLPEEVGCDIMAEIYFIQKVAKSIL
jgi:hypothetical protein